MIPWVPIRTIVIVNSRRAHEGLRTCRTAQRTTTRTEARLVVGSGRDGCRRSSAGRLRREPSRPRWSGIVDPGVINPVGLADTNSRSARCDQDGDVISVGCRESLARNAVGRQTADDRAHDTHRITCTGDVIAYNGRGNGDTDLDAGALRFAHARRYRDTGRGRVR
jgi:hypothetical protein